MKDVFLWVGYSTVALFIAVGFAHTIFFLVEIYTKTFRNADRVLAYYAAWKREQVKK